MPSAVSVPTRCSSQTIARAVVHQVPRGVFRATTPYDRDTIERIAAYVASEYERKNAVTIAGSEAECILPYRIDGIPTGSLTRRLFAEASQPYTKALESYTEASIELSVARPAAAKRRKSVAEDLLASPGSKLIVSYMSEYIALRWIDPIGRVVTALMINSDPTCYAHRSIDGEEGPTEAINVKMPPAIAVWVSNDEKTPVTIPSAALELLLLGTEMPVHDHPIEYDTDVAIRLGVPIQLRDTPLTTIAAIAQQFAQRFDDLSDVVRACT